MLFQMLLLSLFLSNYVAFATLPQDTVQSTPPKSQEQSKTYTSLTDWSAACLSSYDEQKMPKRALGYPSPILSLEEFEHILNEYEEHMHQKGILNKETWAAINKENNALPDDMKYPYATVLKIDDSSQVCFIGDLHGSLHSLLRNLWRLVSLGYLNDQFKIIKKDFFMVFTGDYVDRGRYSIEVLYTLLRLKCANWEHVHLVRGNHDGPKNMNSFGTLNEIDELTKKYKINRTKLNMLSQLYNTMPLAVYIIVNEKIIKAVHGGFGPYEHYFNVRNLIQNSVKTKNENSESSFQISYFYIPIIKEKNDPTSDPTESLATGYQWGDFNMYKKSNKNEDFTNMPINELITKRGGRVWGIRKNAMLEVLDRAGISLVMRGHQHSGFGLKILGITDDSSRFDPDSNDFNIEGGTNILINWRAALPYISTGNQHNTSNGFLVAEILPIFTFSSAVEGVGLGYDCFGILSFNGPFENWRLKVYEFPVWFASKNQLISGLNKPFTLIKPINNASQDKSYTSTSGMKDSIFVEFSETPQEEQTIREWLQEIVNIPIGNNQSTPEHNETQN